MASTDAGSASPLDGARSPSDRMPVTVTCTSPSTSGWRTATAACVRKSSRQNAMRITPSQSASARWPNPKSADSCRENGPSGVIVKLVSTGSSVRNGGLSSEGPTIQPQRRDIPTASSFASVGHRECRLWCRRASDCLRELTSADEQERDRHGGQADSRAHPERRMEPPSESRRLCAAATQQGLVAAGRNGRRDGNTDRPAELLRRVQQTCTETRFMLANTGERGNRDGDKGKGRTDAHDEEWAGQVLPELTVHRNLDRPEDAAADQRHPDRHHDLRRAAGHEQLRQARERDRRYRSGQPRKAGLQGRVPEHLLHVERADEDERKEAAAEQQPDRVCASQRLEAEDSQRHERCFDARLNDNERYEKHSGKNEREDRAPGTPTDGRRLRDRVHEQQQAAGNCECAERVIATPNGIETAFRHDPRSDSHRRDADGHVEEEDGF